MEETLENLIFYPIKILNYRSIIMIINFTLLIRERIIEPVNKSFLRHWRSVKVFEGLLLNWHAV